MLFLARPVSAFAMKGFLFSTITSLKHFCCQEVCWNRFITDPSDNNYAFSNYRSGRFSKSHTSTRPSRRSRSVHPVQVQTYLKDRPRSMEVIGNPTAYPDSEGNPSTTLRDHTSTELLRQSHCRIRSGKKGTIRRSLNNTNPNVLPNDFRTVRDKRLRTKSRCEPDSSV